jgi:hypothetical protein
MNNEELKKKYKKVNRIVWKSQYVHPNMVEVTRDNFSASDFVESWLDRATKTYLMCRLFPHLTMMECEAIVRGNISFEYDEWDGEKYVIRLKLEGQIE